MNPSVSTILLMSSQKGLVEKNSQLSQGQPTGLCLVVAESGFKGLNLVYQSPPALIIVDSTLFDISGLQICRVLKRDPAIQKLPILFICRDDASSYQRFSELALVADAFVEEKALGDTDILLKTLNMLPDIFDGIDFSEKEQLKILQQSSVQVQALSRTVQLFDQSITEEALMKGFRKLFELAPNKNILQHMFSV